MERRLDVLSKEKATAQQESNGLLSMLGNIFGGGGAASGTGAERAVVAAAAELPSDNEGTMQQQLAAALASQQPVAAARQGGTGLWGALFGGSAATSRQQPTQAAAPPVPPPPPIATPAPVSGTSVESAPASPSGSGGGLFGAAARMAMGVASGIRAEQERIRREMDEAEAARRLARANEAVFAALLRDADPPLTPATTYERLEAQLGDDERWVRIDASRRKVAFALHLEGLIAAEAAAAARAADAFRSLLRRSGVSPEDSWAGVRVRLQGEPAFAAVSSEAERARLFEGVVAE
eukprot:352677-Chlamydomonas_euryale.AAC.1